MDSQSKTINDMLELVSLSDNRITPIPEKIMLYRCLTEMLPEFRMVAEAHELRISLFVSEDTECYADSGMLSKVLTNVLLNAVQNTPPGEEVRIWVEPILDFIRVCILNTGVYLEEDVLSKLFDPFYRVDKVRNRKSGRSGLGLTIVRKTLETMDLDFGLTQTKEGILFWMEIPTGSNENSVFYR